MRFSELAKLKYEDIDFNQGTITLRDTKNGDRRVLPLTNPVENILKNCSSYKEGAMGMIFKSERANNKNVSISVEWIREKLGKLKCSKWKNHPSVKETIDLVENIIFCRPSLLLFINS